MTAEDIDRVTLYLPEKIVYHLKHKALYEKTDFSAFVTKILQKRLDNPEEVKLQDWEWRGSRMTTVYLPSQLWSRIKDLASERDIPVNGLVYSLLYEDVKGGRKIKKSLTSFFSL
jgi:predicted DNA binding CopG/RHH family protein